MSWLLVVAALLVIGVIALALTGRAGTDKAYLPVTEPDLRPSGESGNEFDVVLRGYRMDEVDARIAELEAEVVSLKSPLAGEAADPPAASD